ncbi:DUF4882 family protein [Acinetobacter proteolyticus]|uniref:DUF4882 family protein n=1 Tax=Acinetobacter proteolyticus TaxID=1776741 RepID=UPI003D952721
MKKLILGTLFCVSSISSTFAACTYNFDATQNEISAYSPGMLKFPNISGQQASFNVTADTGVKGYMAVSSQYLSTSKGDIAPPSTGVFAFEYKFKVPTNSLTSNEG